MWASNDANPFAATCLPAANYRAGDVLVTRRAAFQPATALAANSMYLRSSYERAEVFKGSTPPPLFTATPRQDFALEAAVYYVSPWSTSASESPQIPGLHRLALGTGPAMTSTLVAGNVEDMQLQFARSTSDLRTRFHNANQLNAAATPSEWTEIAAVRVWLLVRSSAPEAGYQNNQTYVLGDKTVTVNDGYRREVFSTIVQVRNK
jgi:type IV pilus assembly protein PilW